MRISCKHLALSVSIVFSTYSPFSFSQGISGRVVAEIGGPGKQRLLKAGNFDLIRPLQSLLLAPVLSKWCDSHDPDISQQLAS